MTEQDPNPLTAYIVNQSLHWFIVGIGFPIMVLFVLAKGLSLFESGAVIATYSAAAILLELPTGGLSDTIGRKKVYLLSVAFMILSDLALLLSWDFASVALAAFIMGSARALSSGSIDAWFVDEFKRTQPGGNLQRALAKAGAFMPISIGVGSLVGGLLPLAFAGPMKSAGLSIYSINYLVAIGLWAFQFLLTMVIIHEHLDPSRKAGMMDGIRKTPEQIAISVKFGLRNSVIFALILAAVGLGFSMASVELLWQPRVQEIMDVSQQTWVLGALAAGYFFAASIGNLASMPVCHLLRQRYAVVLSLARIGLGVVLFALALQSSIFLFAGLYILLYFLLGTEESPGATLFNHQVPSQYRSTLMSFNSLMLQVGVLGGSIVMGYLASSISISFAWQVAAVALLVSALPYLFLVRRTKAVDAK